MRVRTVKAAVTSGLLVAPVVRGVVCTPTTLSTVGRAPPGFAASKTAWHVEVKNPPDVLGALNSARDVATAKRPLMSGVIGVNRG